MAVLKTDDYLEVYGSLAGDPDLHRLSGRDDHYDLTAFINRAISESLQLTPDQSLLDIGCGDGSLLVGVRQRIATGLGIAPTAPEIRRLQTAHSYPNISFALGTADRLPVADRAFDRIVINGVLLILPDEAVVRRVLLEVKRVSRPGALVWIGEMPDCDELAAKERYTGTSLLGFLFHKWRKKGFRKAVRKAVALLREWKKPQVFLGRRHFWMSADAFLALCQEAELESIWWRRHREIDKHGTESESATRIDYLMRA